MTGPSIWGLDNGSPDPVLAWLRNTFSSLFDGGTPTMRANVGGIRGAAQGQGGVGTRAPTFAPPKRTPTQTGTVPGTPSAAMRSPAWADRHAYFSESPGGMYIPGFGWVDQNSLDAMGLSMDGYGGGGMDNSLGYAQLAQQQEEFAQRMALEQQALAQQAELARLQREEQRRALAMQIGQAMNELTSRNWETGLPWTLPKGTQYAPGAEPGGALAGIAKIGNVGYTPQRLVPSNPPSKETMDQWVKDAISVFSGS